VNLPLYVHWILFEAMCNDDKNIYIYITGIAWALTSQGWRLTSSTREKSAESPAWTQRSYSTWATTDPGTLIPRTLISWTSYIRQQAYWVSGALADTPIFMLMVALRSPVAPATVSYVSDIIAKISHNRELIENIISNTF